MYSGYVFKRNMPISPPSMQKVYSVLCGTLLLDYDSEDDYKMLLSPKTSSEVLGISEWDGQGRANQYSNGFLIVTHTGATYYCAAVSNHERNEWILHVKRALECNFANPEIIPFKPCKVIQTRVPPIQNTHCPRSKQPIPSYVNINCNACGRSFSSNECIQETSTFLQLGIEESEKCCIDCKSTQLIVIWLKKMNYYHVTTLHEHTPAVMTDVIRYKASFKLRRRISTRLDMAATLLENKSISLDEFEELRRVDHEYRRELIFEESGRLHEALDTIGDDMQMIIDLLLNPSITERGGRMSYYQIIKTILVLADEQPDLIDFYWPQLIHVHFIESSNRSNSSLMKVDLLQQMLLSIARKYAASLGVKLAWSLLATINDYKDYCLGHASSASGNGVKFIRVTQRQYASSMSLLLQLELIITGFISPISDSPMSMLLARTLVASTHQQQEIGIELVTLLLVRRKLQEVYDEEELLRSTRNEIRADIYSDVKPSQNSSSTMPTLPIDKFKKSALRNDVVSCVTIFLSLGVGRIENKMQSTVSSVNYSESNTPVTSQKISNTYSILQNEKNEKSLECLSNLGEENIVWTNFGDQLDYFYKLTNIVDSLRFVERSLRTSTFRTEITKLIKQQSQNAQLRRQNSRGQDNQNKPSDVILGWDPTIPAGGPRYRITSIEIDECRVFRTKARAPSLILCQIMRETSIDSKHHKHQKSGTRDPDDVDANVDSSLEVHENGSLKSNLESSDGSDVELNNDFKSKLAISIDEVDGLLNSNMSKALEDIKNNKQTKINPSLSSIPETSLHKSTSLTSIIESKSVSTSHSDSKTNSLLNSNSDKRHKSLNASVLDSRNGTSSNSSENASNGSIASSNSPFPSKKSSFVASHRKSVNFFSLLDSVSGNDVPKNHHTSHHAQQSMNYSMQSTNALLQLDKSLQTSRDTFTTDPSSNSPTSLMNRKSFSDKSSDLDFLMEIVEAPILPEPIEMMPPKNTESEGISPSKNSSSSLSSMQNGQETTLTTQAATMLTQTSATNTALVTRKVFFSAQKLLLSGKINEKEYNQLILSDFKYRNASVAEEDMITSNRVQHAFGESWKSKKARILGDRVNYSVKSKVTTDSCKGEKSRELMDTESVHGLSSKNISSNGSAEMLVTQDNSCDSDNKSDVITTSAEVNNTKSIIKDDHNTDINANDDMTSLEKYSENLEEKCSSTKLVDNEVQDSAFDDSTDDLIAGVPVLLDSTTTIDDAYFNHSNESVIKVESIIDAQNDTNIQLAPKITIKESYDDDLDTFGEEDLSINVDEDFSENGCNNEHDYPLWDIKAFIIKSNDDLRQEMCCLQVMHLCSEIFHDLSLDRYLYLKPYHIVNTSNTTGIVEVIPNTISMDALKKTHGFTTLSNYFKSTYGTSAERLLHVKRNFASSLAAYSLLCYILAIKDRHNGNILLDNEGHLIHIDFGFLLSIAPGGSFSLETAPFKLTEEMVDVLGGLESPLFGQFVKSFTVGFLALRSHIEVIISCINVLSIQSAFPCFYGKDSSVILEKVRSRFRQDLNPKDFVKHCLDLIVASYGHYGTKQYDNFQWYTNGIIP